MGNPVPASNAIVTLDYVKTYLKITTEDTVVDEFLQSLINQASSIIENHTHRTIVQQIFSNDIYDGDGRCKLTLRRRPIISLKTPGVEDLQYRVDVDASWLTLEPNEKHIIIRPDKPYKIELYANAFPIGVQNIQLSAKYGYTAIPGRFIEVCTEMVAQSFKKSDQKGGRLAMASKNVSSAGGAATDSFIQLNDQHKAALATYVWYSP